MRTHALAQRQVASDPDSSRGLSSREFEVLRMLLQGHGVKDIADAMGLNPKTIANHQSAIKQKLGVETGIQLAQIGGALIDEMKQRG